MAISKLTTGAITDNAVTAAKIAAGAVEADIATGGITTTKIADDAVTTDKLANSINSAITANTAKTGISSAQTSKLSGIATSANNYVHPNHSGDVVSAADGAMTIQTDAVDIAMLSATGTPGNTTFLRGDNAWATAGSTSASDLTSGTLPDARFPSTLPAISGANLTGLSSFDPDGAVVFNESGADVDFRVESDTITHALHLDATNGQIANGSGSFKLGLQTTATNNYGWNFDIADAGTISCAQGTAVKIGNFTSSGMILVNDTTVTGQVGLFVTGGAGFTICGQTNAVYQITSSPGTNHVGLYQAGGYVYIKNGMPQNLGASIMTFRTRAAQ